MKTARKALLIALCAVLLVAVSVMGTLAYLTSTTEVVTNTFSIGQVGCTLDEAKVDEYGEPVEGAGRVVENTYKLIPGHKYTKDPTVHMSSTTEDAWLFVKVENGISAIEADTKIADQMGTIGWTPVAEGSNIFYYKDAVSANDNIVVFNNFTIADNAEVDQYANANITIQALAIQKDGFENAMAAWTGNGAQWPNA